MKPLKWWANDFIATAPHKRHLSQVILYCKVYDKKLKGWFYSTYILDNVRKCI